MNNESKGIFTSDLLSHLRYFFKVFLRYFPMNLNVVELEVTLPTLDFKSTKEQIPIGSHEITDPQERPSSSPI